MAKQNKRSPLMVNLVLGMDDFAPGLKKARELGLSEGATLNQALGGVANNLAARLLSVQAAIGLAKKGYHEFIEAAQRLEKQGGGNEGTAAIARISEAVERMQEGFVKAVLSTDLMRDAVTAFAFAAEAGAVALSSWSGASNVAATAVRMLGAETLDFLSDMSSKTSAFGTVVRGALLSLPGVGVLAGAAGLGVQTMNATGAAAGVGNSGASDALRRQADALRTTAKEGLDKLNADIRAQRVEASERALSSTGRGVVDAFVSSWASGFDRLGDMFRNFSVDVSTVLGNMSSGTAKALGETFEAVAFLGPQLERVYGQSAKGAARFQAAQLALVGSLAVVKGVMALADAWDHTSKDQPGAAIASIAAAAGYAGAAALAGYSAAQTLSGRSGGAAGGGMATSEQLGQERRSVTVVIQNAVGSERFVREEVIPALNRAVRADTVLLSTNSQSAGSLQPGRY